ncbi:MAG TPA: FxLYD domain-containing protein [Polyangia bacterium]|jgi:hypothetical protein
MKSKGGLVAGLSTLLACFGCSGNSPAHPAGSGGTAGGGGSGGVAGAQGDGRSFVPEDLSHMPRAGEVGVTLNLVAFTLLEGTTGPAFYAAVENDGDAPSCNAGMMTDFIDKSGQTVASVGSPLLSKQFYQLEANVILGCIDLGQIGMVAATDLPAEVVPGDLGSLTYNFPTFGVGGITPIAAFAVSGVKAVAKVAGTAYAGALANGLDVMVTGPSVTISPVNRVGRPLGAATASATTDIPPGGSWSFETSSVDDVGVDEVAYPSASISN